MKPEEQYMRQVSTALQKSFEDVNATTQYANRGIPKVTLRAPVLDNPVEQRGLKFMVEQFALQHGLSVVDTEENNEMIFELIVSSKTAKYAFDGI